jgi:elongation factor P
MVPVLSFKVKNNMLSASELKTGVVFKDSNTPYKVEKYEHSKTARSGATIRLRVRSLLDGSVAEKVYSSVDMVAEADVYRKSVEFLYKDNFFVFMDPTTYEQIEVSEDVVGDNKFYLKENEKYTIMYFEDNPVSVEVPNSLIFEVEYTEPGFKGNTVTNTLKDAKLVNGMDVKVPTFIKIGDKIKVDTRTGEYMARA